LAVAIWLLALVLLSSLRSCVRPLVEVQAFFNHYPFHECTWDLLHRSQKGSSRLTRLPAWMNRFDWLLDHFVVEFLRGPLGNTTFDIFKSLGRTPDHRRAKDVRTVFASPLRVSELLTAARADFDGGRSDRVVVFGGSDVTLSKAFGRTDSERRQAVGELRRYFGTILFEARDVDVDGVLTMPVGLVEQYFRAKGGLEGAVAAIAAARTDASFKARGVLAAMGATSSTADICRDVEFVERFDVGTASRAACESRTQLQSWATSPAAEEAAVDFRSIDPASWYSELSTYRFVIAPLGTGIQSHKQLEALLVLTVPIVQRGSFPVFDDLVKLGFPLVVIDDWAEITPSNLSRWWDELSPQLARFRHSCLTAEAYWGLVNGERHCR